MRRNRVVAIALLALLLAAAGCRGSDTSSRSPVTPSRSPGVAAPSTAASAAPGTSLPRVPFDPYAGARPEAAPAGARSEATIVTPDGRTRHHRLYVPTGVASGAKVPLLVALHGGLGSSAQFEANSGFDGLAEANGFIVAYPDGIAAVPGTDAVQTWNGGTCCGAAVQRNVDDVAYLRALIARLTATQPVDERRIVVAGHSNGAVMAYRLACEAADLMVAVGLQAGSLGVPSCVPSRPVSLFHLHGLADENVPIDGGRGSGISGADFRPARESVEALARADACVGTPDAFASSTNPDLAVVTWGGCAGGATVRLVTVAGAGHAWMGRPATSAAAAALVGTPYADLDASRAIWSFLSTRARPAG